MASTSDCPRLRIRRRPPTAIVTASAAWLHSPAEPMGRAARRVPVREWPPGGASLLTASRPNLFGGRRTMRAQQPTSLLTIAKSDYDAFERLLGDIQGAFSTEDLSALRTMVTPEMLSYFSEQLAGNASRGLFNRVTDVKLLQGDLAEAWREGRTDYATVAMKFALKDSIVERASRRTVEGGERTEVTELSTFMRASGGNWPLSAIQQRAPA